MSQEKNDLLFTASLADATVSTKSTSSSSVATETSCSHEGSSRDSAAPIDEPSVDEGTEQDREGSEPHAEH